jgi:putative hydrolase of the HAD superfamily
MDTAKIKRLIFDADDTLWENNIFYIRAAEDLVHLIHEAGFPESGFPESGFPESGFPEANIVREFQRLERQVVRKLGYGSENYVYILRTLFKKYVPDSENTTRIEKFEKICRDFENHVTTPPRLFPDVPKILKVLKQKYPLYVLTKGNIKEQKKKLERSNLLIYFQEAFVESEKDIQTYRRILKEKQWKASEVCMIGNSPKSDINPAIKLGMSAVFIPYKFTWVLEDEPLIENRSRLISVQNFSDLKTIFA